MSYTDEQLLALKKRIDKSKTELTEIKANKKFMLQELNTKWGCETIEQARKKLEEKKSEIKILDTKLEQEMKGIEKMLVEK